LLGSAHYQSRVADPLEVVMAWRSRRRTSSGKSPALLGSQPIRGRLIRSKSSWLRRSRSHDFERKGHARTRWLQSRARGNENGVTDEQDRERESRLTDENKFVELQEEVADETRRAAERLATDPVVNEPPADE